FTFLTVSVVLSFSAHNREPTFSKGGLWVVAAGRGEKLERIREGEAKGIRGGSAMVEGMGSERQLVVAVEGTAALGPYWPAIAAEYVEKIVRSFCSTELSGQKLAGVPPELALVVFHTHGPYSAFIVQRSGWTKDMDAFLSWLSGISFSGGGFSEAAICEGLAEALMILQGSPGSSLNHQNRELQKHCLLVAASNPYPLPTPVYRPSVQSSDHKKSNEATKESCLADAETVAVSFAQSSVSLSVVSPKQLPTLKAIYNA
uniref:Mediator of RNA polymerase II transcription subunit 25 n=2 Tax=Aegilops tauschii subsp. strangulata TaxID=200361 RepID=A0A453KL92_AEGTS